MAAISSGWNRKKGLLTILAGVGTGVYDDVRDVSKKLARCGRVTVPDEEEAAVYRRYHDLYDRLYDHMKQDFNDLYEL